MYVNKTVSGRWKRCAHLHIGADERGHGAEYRQQPNGHGNSDGHACGTFAATYNGTIRTQIYIYR